MAKSKSAVAVRPDEEQRETLNRALSVQIPPLLDLPIGYLPRVVKVDLNQPQRETLKRLTETLQAEAVQLQDGKFVNRPLDAIRWFLEQIDLEDSAKREKVKK